LAIHQQRLLEKYYIIIRKGWLAMTGKNDALDLTMVGELQEIFSKVVMVFQYSIHSRFPSTGSG
jgi:hypothetical protein